MISKKLEAIELEEQAKTIADYYHALLEAKIPPELAATFAIQLHYRLCERFSL